MVGALASYLAVLPASADQAPNPLARNIIQATSDDGIQDRLDIRGYTDTARKHGLGAYEAMRQLMRGSPWLPATLASLPVTAPENRATDRSPYVGVNA